MSNRRRSAAMSGVRSAVASVLLAAVGASCSGARRIPSTQSQSSSQIEGVVLDASGRPVPNAVVAVRAGRMLDFRRALPAATVTTGSDGRFRLPARGGDAREIVTAMLPGTGAARWGPEHAPGEPILLTLAPGLRISGVVRLVEAGAAAGASVRAVAGTREDFPVVFPSISGADGTFALEVPAGDEYAVFADAGESMAPPALVLDGAQTKLELRLRKPDGAEPIDQGRAAAWIASAARAMAADGDADDLAPLDRLVEGARVVALGEHSHGTREFHTFRGRVFRRLVQRHGFTVLAMEGSFYRGEKLDRFVQTGEGDPDAILADHYHWNSRDLVAELNWMREWNADARHSRKVRFFGFDVWTHPMAGERLRTFLEHVDPQTAALLGKAIPELTTWGRKTSAADIAVAEMLVRALNPDARARWRASVSDGELRTMRHDARLMALQARVIHGGSITGYSQRDPGLAANVRELLDADPGVKILLYAHGAHVTRGDLPFGVRAMGSYLAEALGDQYRTIGLAFGEGSYWTYDLRPAKPALKVVAVGPPPPRTFEALLARAGSSHYLDFRTAPADVVRWLERPRLMRLADEGFTDEESLEVAFPPRGYDAMFYVARSTPLVRSPVSTE